MKIGVFDSGIGGEKMARLLQSEFPKSTILSISDTDNLPYGNKTKAHLISLVVPKIQLMEQNGCDMIVIACNTVTTNLIKEVREAVNVPVVGFEPMIKPASKLTKSAVITVCATPATLSSYRYKRLKSLYAANIEVIEPDCSTWAKLIETNKINQNHIRQIIDISKASGSDVIVLGCTHYHWIENLIQAEAGEDIIVIQPEEPILKRIRMIATDIEQNLKD